MNLSKHLILMLILFISGGAYAQTSAEDLEVINLEDLYKKEETKVPVPAPTPVSRPSNVLPDGGALATDPATPVPTTAEQQPEEIKVKELKDLNQLVPFSEISVIQKKFMPKTERLQLFAAAGLATNSPWFNSYGGKLNLSYNFTESFGLEINTLFLSSSQRDVAKEIFEQHNIQAEQFVTTKNYLGLDFVWSPIYGKIAFNDSSIINYEMYFSLGGGKAETNSIEKNVTAFHLGIGQIFSISKSVAFRWDYGATSFQATPLDPNSPTPTSEKSTYTDLILTAGFSFFFPEAGYR